MPYVLLQVRLPFVTIRRRLLAPVLAMGVLLTLGGSPAAAQTVPNLIALTSEDGLVAITYAAAPNSTTLARAGAFATTMIDQYGMTAIANYDAAQHADSVLVCESPLNANELLGVYGLAGDGVVEATAVCQTFSDNGQTVRWR